MIVLVGKEALKWKISLVVHQNNAVDKKQRRR